MSRTTDYIIIFVAGLTAGALCAKFYYEDKYRTLAEEEINSVKEAFKDKTLVVHVKDVSKPVEKEEHQEEEIIREYSAPTEVGTATNYHDFYKGEPILEEKMAMKEFPREETRPRIISQEDYDGTEPDFDKMSCTFYVPDRIIVDDLSREVVEPDVIGEENIEYMIESKEPIICIRNERIAVDMEISRNETSAVETGDVVWRG